MPSDFSVTRGVLWSCERKIIFRVKRSQFYDRELQRQRCKNLQRHKKCFWKQIFSYSLKKTL
jgi:hypothetical protein